MTTIEEEKEEEEERKKKKIVAKINKKKAELSMLATSLFAPVGKNPYYLNRDSNSIAIKNITELIANLDAFTEEEAPWLASWIEYLGDDKETAARIRKTPGEFKEIIAERYDELREFYK